MIDYKLFQKIFPHRIKHIAENTFLETGNAVSHAGRHVDAVALLYDLRLVADGEFKTSLGNISNL